MSTLTQDTLTGGLHTAAIDGSRLEAYLPTPCLQNHASFLHELPNGDLLCAWFGGTQEGVPDISIHISRLKKGNDQWSEPVKLSDDGTRSEQNPVLFTAPDGALWLLYTAQLSGHQNTAIVRYRISQDGGRQWSEPCALFDTPGIFIRQPPVFTRQGNWVLPVFVCRVAEGERWTGNDDISAVMVSEDSGTTWHQHDVPDSVGCVHMNIQPLKDGTYLALYRSRWADAIYSSRSEDALTWSAPKATELPNNNSSLQFTCLDNGHLALVYNHRRADLEGERRASLYDDIEDAEDHGELIDQASKHGKAAFWGAPRAPMTLALSTDGGHSWPIKRDLEIGDGYCMTNNSVEKKNREYSYPTIIQGQDGKLHIAFTYFRQRIKYVRVAVSWASA
ncbi:putative neuraminidase [Vreelandella songnenensis]|uniref:Putative neuraminidase n=1 Tax=Vreelandella songnenensis TaxID=1176243 RepID=A0A2T0V7Q5_9GAMM|nr:exo-alpha-sialidase [Halomonas songnenensis]PRY66210.1 putative neuraminidase [Halomonas songnenensis]